MTNRFRTFLTIILIMTTWMVSFAHENWICLEYYFPVPGDSVTYTINSGHDFPESSFLLEEKNLKGVFSTGPCNPEISGRRADKKGRSWKGTVIPTVKGYGVIGFALVRPVLDDTLYLGKTMFSTNPVNLKRSDTDDRVADGESLFEMLLTGHGLEITTTTTPNRIKSGSVIPLAVYLNGKRVNSVITIQPALGKVIRLSTSPDREAEWHIKENGLYLLTAHTAGRGASLVIRAGFDS